jgi:hypothetical protein
VILQAVCTGGALVDLLVARATSCTTAAAERPGRRRSWY